MQMFVVVLLVSVAVGRLVSAQSSSTESIINQAMRFFDSGMQQQQQQSVSNLMTSEDSRAQKMLRDSISIATGSSLRQFQACLVASV